MKVGGYRICNTHGPHSEPSCQLCQADLNIRMAAIADSIAEQAHEKEQERAMTQPAEPDRTAPEWDDWKITPGSWPHWMLERMNRETGRMSYDNPVKGMIRDLWATVCRTNGKPEPKEWDGEGWPPVGLTNKQFKLMTHVSVACNEHPETHYEVIGYYNGAVVVAGVSFGRTFAHQVRPEDCRPFRTKEQRERDELIAAALLACPYPGNQSTKVDILALYDAGMLRKGGE